MKKGTDSVEMKIIFFSSFYLPEPIAPSFRVAENAEWWRRMGHEVTVFTGYPNHPVGKIYSGYQVKLLGKEIINKIKILRCKMIVKPNVSFFRRIINGLSFYFFGLINLIVNRKKIGSDFNIVVGSSPVIFTAFLAWNYAVINKIPFVFELRDLTYLQLQAAGRRENSMGVRLMKYIELFLCKRARTVIVTTHGFRSILAGQGIHTDKIAVITNGVDVPEQTEHEQTAYDLLLSYYGTLGISQNIKGTFPYAAEIGKYCKNFCYQIIGDGAQREELEHLLQGKKYPFVKIMHSMAMEKLENYYKQTRMSVVTLVKSDSFQYTIPSKLFQIMGRGIAVLYIGPEGEAAEIIRKYDAGITLVGSLEQDRKKIKEFFENPEWKERLEEMGKKGYTAVREFYSRKKLASQYEGVLASAAKKNVS